jgi:hypothetical protein
MTPWRCHSCLLVSSVVVCQQYYSLQATTAAKTKGRGRTTIRHCKVTRHPCRAVTTAITTATRIYPQRPGQIERRAISAGKKAYVFAAEETTKRSFARSIRGQIYLRHANTTTAMTATTATTAINVRNRRQILRNRQKTSLPFAAPS